MRTASRLAAVVLTTTLTGAVAWAQQPVDPYGTADVAGPATEPAQPVNPYTEQPQYPPPSTYGYQPPSAGPAQVDTQPPAYQRGYYLYPSNGQAPVYYAPPSCCCCCNACGQYPAYPPYALRPPTLHRPKKWDGVRRFSIGVHGTALWLNQQVGNDQVVLGGAGFQLRMRTKGHWGLELSQDFLHASYWNGNYDRTALPFTVSLMFYLFPNQDTRHFNLYALAGFGAMFDALNLRDEHNQMVEQDFLEWIGHVGVGAELRFKWFAIDADWRVLGTLRDDSSTPAAYYSGVAGAPVPSSSWGMSGNVYLNLWF